MLLRGLAGDFAIQFRAGMNVVLCLVTEGSVSMAVVPARGGWFVPCIPGT